MKLSEEKLRSIIREELQNLNEARARTEPELMDMGNDLEKRLRNLITDLEDFRRSAGELGYGNMFDRDLIRKAQNLEQALIEINQDIQQSTP